MVCIEGCHCFAATLQHVLSFLQTHWLQVLLAQLATRKHKFLQVMLLKVLLLRTLLSSPAG